MTARNKREQKPVTTLEFKVVDARYRVVHRYGSNCLERSLEWDTDAMDARIWESVTASKIQECGEVNRVLIAFMESIWRRHVAVRRRRRKSSKVKEPKA